MEFMDLVRKRQSVRKFKPGDVPNEDIRQMLEAARLSPSGKNSQNWHFVVIKRRDLLEKIGAAISKKSESIASRMDPIDETKALRFRKFTKNFTLFFLNAPVLIVVYACDYFPSGYPELSLINEKKGDLDRLFMRNPGMQNLGAAIEHLSLRAVELGYGSCWMTSQNYAADEIEEVLKTEIGFQKDGYYLAAMLSVGIPEDDLKSPGRKSIEEISTFVE